MLGGIDDDTYVVDNAGDLVTESFNEGTDTIQSSITWTLDLGNNVENLTLTGTKAINGTGNELSNTLIGNTANNLLTGLDGNDTLTGGTGNDTLVGGRGNDLLTGGTGADLFRFDNPNQGLDTISDFSVSQLDKIQVSATGFSGNLLVGTLTASQFISGAEINTAMNSSQRFIYNSSSGALFYDADGNGMNFNAVQIATLSGLPAINSTFIQVIT